MVIAVGEDYKIQGNAPPSSLVKQKPLHFAPITLVEGEQKSGKTCFCVTRVVDAVFKYVTSVKLPNQLVVKAEPALKPNGYSVTGWAKLWLPNQLPKIMKVPAGSIVRADGVRIFANFHLKGIRFVYLQLADIIQHLNDGTINGLSTDGSCIIAFLIIDEAYIGGDKRDGMTPLSKCISKLGYQIAKRHLNVMFAAPDTNVLDFRIRGVETEHVTCSYDEERETINAEIKSRKKYNRPRNVPIQARPYWKYYNPDEQFELPDIQLERAMESARTGG